MSKNRITKHDIHRMEMLRDRVEMLFNQIIALLEETSELGD